MSAAMREAAALLPCPFCGHLPELEDGVIDRPWTVQCMNADCLVLCAMDGADTKKQAIATWNRRALPVPQADDLPKKPENLGTSDERVKDVDRVALAIVEAINPNRDFRLNPHNEAELSGWRRAARAAIAALPRDQIEAEVVERCAQIAEERATICFDARDKIKAGTLYPNLKSELSAATETCAGLEARHIAELIRRSAPPVRHPDAGGDL